MNTVATRNATGQSTAQLIRRAIEGPGPATLEDMKVLFNQCPEALGALRNVAGSHGLTRLQGLVDQYERWEARYWASMC